MIICFSPYLVLFVQEMQKLKFSQNLPDLRPFRLLEKRQHKSKGIKMSDFKNVFGFNIDQEMKEIRSKK